MKKGNIILGFMLCVGITVSAQAKKDKEIINRLCGCFDVEFKYAETFSPDTAYKFHEREKITGGTELAIPITITDNKIVIQHLLVVSDSMIVKHWREDWTYQNTSVWKYIDTKSWVKQLLPSADVKNKWTQSVWEVSDEPRYQGYSPFVSLDGEVLWQSTTDAPLPRREYSIRNDYNILNRTNRLHITNNGYVHEQDNKKIIRKNGVDKLLVEEKGLNTYKRIDNNKCNPAKLYWEKNKIYWIKVENIWSAYVDAHNTIKLKPRVDERPLHDFLFSLLDDYNDKKIKDAEIDGKIKEAIEKFIII